MAADAVIPVIVFVLVYVCISFELLNKAIAALLGVMALLILGVVDDKTAAQFIDYEKVEEFKGFGGIRIEDDVLVTNNGHRVLGIPIPKTVEEIENIMGK